MESGAVVRLAELVATLSLATDLGRGQPMEHCVRQTAVSLHLADLLALDEAGRAATYYVGLLDSVYCHADAYEQARWFGDDVGLKADTYKGDPESLRVFLAMLRRVGSGESGLARARRVAAFPARGWKEVGRFLHTHSTLQAEFAHRIGLPNEVSDALENSYERWDGKGIPHGLQGDAIPLPARIVTLADLVEVHNRVGGMTAAREVVRERANGQVDPALAELFLEHADEIVERLDSASAWDDVIAAEPGLGRVVAGAELDAILEAMGDLIDMKSPHFAGHSRGVANVAGEAAQAAERPPEEVATIRRAGFVHDLGRLGISNAIWDKPGSLSAAERERVRLHPYLTERMLSGVAALGTVRRVAARHHERLDGSGYPGALTAPELSPADRILAAADVYHALCEPRPHREAFSSDRAAGELRAEAKAGRLDGDAVNAVLSAAGHRAPARREWPAGLTAREVEVLGLLARGASNKEIAKTLIIAPKTVSKHVEHIYSKAGVNSRAAATLFATRNGLVGSFEPS